MAHLVITGASTGIGRVTAVRLADRFDRLTLIGRDADRHASVIDELTRAGRDVRLVQCDLVSLDLVAGAAAELRGSAHADIDVLIANAGVGGQRGMTVDGFEIHFGVNHLAHHLLITEVADLIADRVVIVSSNAHYDSEGLDLDRVQRRTSSFTGFTEYRDSKLANVLAGREMARRFSFASHIVHPGMTATRIWRRIPWPIRPIFTRRMASPEEGADTPAWAATTPGLSSGGYYAKRTLREPSRAALDADEARELWERSEQWVEPFRRQS